MFRICCRRTGPRSTMFVSIDRSDFQGFAEQLAAGSNAAEACCYCFDTLRPKIKRRGDPWRLPKTRNCDLNRYNQHPVIELERAQDAALTG